MRITSPGSAGNRTGKYMLLHGKCGEKIGKCCGHSAFTGTQKSGQLSAAPSLHQLTSVRALAPCAAESPPICNRLLTGKCCSSGLCPTISGDGVFDHQYASRSDREVRPTELLCCLQQCILAGLPSDHHPSHPVLTGKCCQKARTRVSIENKVIR